MIVCTIVSLLTAPPSLAKIQGLTFGTLTPEQKSFAKNSYAIIDVLASILLVIVIIGILFYFQG